MQSTNDSSNLLVTTDQIVIQTTPSRATSASISMYPDSVSSTGTSAESELLDGEDRKFICPHCDHTFTRKHNLKSHLLIHTREKPFHCSICSSKFRRLHDLKRHEKLHTGEKPYQCRSCGRKFARMDALVRHNNSQSGCTLSAEDSILENKVHGDSSTFSPVSTGTTTPRLNPIQTPLQAAHEVTIAQSGPGIHPSRKTTYETNQWKLNTTLPPINKLTPLIGSIDSTNSQKPSLTGETEAPYNEGHSKNFDLLPYVKILESRISMLETKLSATETKLAQLTYSVHHGSSNMNAFNQIQPPEQQQQQFQPNP